MKKFLVALVGLGIVVAPAANADYTQDQLCTNPAYVSGSHYQGGQKISHKDLCKDAVMPWDY